ncbi:MAG: bifunctional (p)ppGpp synthetase/guanosine-3',5'-bis(diphosphate) 3'-pyrophosphohydrolase [Proteobacteria bacterium]|nr:bifunctional (p)ppGpp synthetase/guanosine-3',5'-bis(diphosphate) 3'-pyrophosphohydrolase [Pseudomonadota bacterium]
MSVAATISGVRDFALAKHEGQVRRHDGRPYFVHLDGVVAILIEHGHKSEDIIAAAFLHDTIEKTETTIEELIEKFGAPVAELVYWLTDTEKGTRQSRALQTAWRLSRAPWNAKLIKLADIIDNGTAIIMYNPDFGPTFLDEKRLQLKKMAEIEGSRLLRLPLFQKAATITESATL